MSQKKIIVLGVGLTGKGIAIKLSEEYDVTCADIQLCSLEALSPQYPVTVIPCNFKDTSSLKELIRPFDLVINAVSSSIGFRTLQAVLEEKKNVVNLSQFPEDIFSLNSLAKRNNVCAIVDLSNGADPGRTTSSIVNRIFGKKLPVAGVHAIEKELIPE